MKNITMMEVDQVSGGIQYGEAMDLITVLTTSNSYIAALTIITPKAITAMLTSNQYDNSKQAVTSYFNSIVESLGSVVAILYKQKRRQHSSMNSGNTTGVVNDDTAGVVLMGN